MRSSLALILILFASVSGLAQDTKPKVFIEAPETVVATNTIFSTSVSKTSMEGWYISRWAKDCPQTGITNKKESADYVVNVSSGVSVFDKDGNLVFTHKEWQPKNAVKDACAAIAKIISKH